MASRSYQRASDFLNYSPGLASNILAEQKNWKKGKNVLFFYNCFPNHAWHFSLPKTDLIMIIDYVQLVTNNSILIVLIAFL